VEARAVTDYVAKVQLKLTHAHWSEIVRKVAGAAGALECLSWQAGETLTAGQTEAAHEISVEVNQALDVLFAAVEVVTP
jgi:hypothetical protein